MLRTTTCLRRGFDWLPAPTKRCRVTQVLEGKAIEGAGIKNWEKMAPGRKRKEMEKLMRRGGQRGGKGEVPAVGVDEKEGEFPAVGAGEMGDRNEVKVRYMDKLRVVEEKERKGWEEAWKELEEMGFSKEPPARSAKEGDGGEKVRFLDGLPVVKRRREGRGRLGDGLVRFPLLGRVGAMMPGPRAEAEAEGFVKEAHSETEEEKYVEPLPFPFPILHVGTDIVRISRIEQIMKDKLGRRFLKKLLTKEEALAMWTDGATVTTMRQNEWTLFWWEMVKWKKAERIAGRFAVKEAVMKAHPHRRLTFHDILVFNDKSPVPLGSAGNGVVSDRMERLGSGPPRVYVKGDKEGQPYQEVRVSISHDGDYATAVCMGVEVPPGR